MKHIFLMFVMCAMGLTAQAQDFGLLGGIHQTDLDVDGDTGTAKIESELGYRFGLAAKYEISDAVTLRPGVLYTLRQYSVKDSATLYDADFKFSYLDIPVLFQFQMNEMVAFYVGPVVAFNLSKKVKGTDDLGLQIDGDVDNIKSMIILAQAGLNFNFDQIGFDLYYERGITDTLDNAKSKYGIFGANFLFWF